MDNEPRLTLLTDPASPAFDCAMDIYERSFPEDEREPRSYFEHCVAESKVSGDLARFTWAIADEKAVVGMAHLVADRVARTLFFVYVAIDAPHRGRFGAKRLIRRIVEETVQQSIRAGIEPVGVIFEVERIEDADDPAEARFREKRLGFFKAVGGILLSRCYVQPALGPDKRPVRLNLMLVPLSDSWNRETLIKNFYLHIFSLGPTDPLVASALAEDC